jgi:hypothetical protein
MYSKHGASVDHERRAHDLPDLRLVFVSVDFNRFRIAIPARHIAHYFRRTFLTVTIDRERENRSLMRSVIVLGGTCLRVHSHYAGLGVRSSASGC